MHVPCFDFRDASRRMTRVCFVYAAQHGVGATPNKSMREEQGVQDVTVGAEVGSLGDAGKGVDGDGGDCGGE
eukprot:7384222-Prymnesium_polylepis.1